MFEQTPGTSNFASRPLKAIAIASGGLLLSVGFCGLDAHLYPHSKFGGSALAVIGAALGVVSVLVLIGSILTLIITAILQAFRK